MIFNKKTIVLILIFFLFNNFSYSKINLQIIMKINDQIITTYDIEKESNYLLALNPKLNEISKNDLLKLAKRSMIKEMIRKSEILKYKEINLKNDQINIVLKNIIQNMDFTNQSQFENYLNDFNVSIDDLRKKIGIENEWKNLVYSKYSTSIKIDKENLINKIEKSSKEEFSKEYNLSEIVFTKKQNISLEDQSKEILESIKIKGFEETVIKYSISNTKMKSGLVGWVDINTLNKKIKKEVENLDIGKISNPISLPSGILLLKINDKKTEKVEIDENKELEKLIETELTNQLNNYSTIFFNKIKNNQIINEY